MGAACCRCVQPASVQPRKTYNTLVGQLFSVVPIKTDDAIDSTMRRKIQKLQEYLQANPAKVPKASRRLMRRIRATLRKPGDNLGHVKVAVHTYAYLLAKCTDEASSYGPNFFLKELLTGPDPVVPLLLRDIHIEMRTLGAELLAVFTSVQSPVDSKLDAIQAHVPLVCRVAQAALQSDRKEQKLQEANERRRAGDLLAVPDPIYLIGRRDPAHVAALEVACLRCLKEVVVLCRKNKVVPAQIHEIQAVMLDNLHPSRGGSGAYSSLDGGAAPPNQPASSAAPTPLPDSRAFASTAGGAAPPGVVDAAFYGAMGMQQQVSQSPQPRAQAEQLLLQMASFTQDISMVDRILDSFYEYMDDRDRWQEAGVVKNFLAALGAGGARHPFPIFASLLRHARSRKLGVADCSAVLRVAKDQGVQLDEAYSLSALQLALEELPRAWAEQARRDPKGLLMLKPFMDFLRAGTAAMKDFAHIGDSPTPGQQQQPHAAAAGAASAKSSSQQAVVAPAAAAAATPSASGQAAGGEAAGGGALGQQLSRLRLTMLETVQGLAGRVQTAAELCEVITGVLTSVSTDLHYQSAPRRLSGAGGWLPGAANVPATQVGSSPFQTAALGSAAGGAGGASAQVAREGSTAAAAATVDASRLATASMALELAATAAETRLAEQDSFVTPCSSFTGTAAVRPGSSSGHSLAGGVLPAKLVAAALPMLAHGPPVLRHAVQRILLALLPAAPQGVATPAQACQLAEAALVELGHNRNTSAPSGGVAAAAAATAADDPAQDDSYSPALVAGADSLLRCSYRGQRPPPPVVLTVSRALLQLQMQVAEHGYRGSSSSGSSGNVGPGRVHASLLLFNSQLAALADVTKLQAMRSHQLPLDPQGHPSLLLTAAGLLLASSGGSVGAAATTAAAAAVQRGGASPAALQALEQQHPPSSQHAESLKATLLQVPLLAEEYGDQLPALLDPRHELHMTASGGDFDLLRDKTQASPAQLLPERKATFSRGKLLHVSDLLQRNSMTRGQNLPSVASVVDSTSGSSAAVSLASPPVATVAEAAEEVSISPAAAAAAIAAHSAASAEPNGLPGVSVIAKGSFAQPQQQTVSAQDVHVQVAGAKGLVPQQQQQQQPQAASAHVSLSDAVAAVLQQPGPVGAYVARDIQISRLAGELDACL